MSRLIVLIFVSLKVFAASEPGVSDKEVVIGAHVSSSGRSAYTALYHKALAAFFDDVNQLGGVEGRKIRWITIDSQSLQPKTVQAVRTLVEQDKVLALVGAAGATHLAAFDYIVEKKIPDLYFTDFVTDYVKPLRREVFPAWFTYDLDGAAQAKHVVNNYQGKKACWLTHNSASGEQLVKYMKEGIELANQGLPKEKRVVIGIHEKIDRQASNVNSETLRLKKENCDVVTLAVSATLGPKAINFANSQGYRPKWTTYWSNIVGSFLKLVDPEVRDGITSTIAFAVDPSMNPPDWKKFEEFCKKHGFEIDPMSARAFSIGEIFAETLKRAGKSVNREKLIQAAESLGGWKCSLCSNSLGLSPTQHSAVSDPLWIVSKGGKWVGYEGK